MYKIQIKIDQLLLRFSPPTKNDQIYPIYLRFNFRQENQWVTIGKGIQFAQNLQKIDISHIVYVKKQQLQEKILKYQMILKGYSEKTQKKIYKIGGECSIKINDFNLLNKDLPFGIEQKVLLKRCPVKEAYLKFTFKFYQLQDFKNLLQNKSSFIKTDNQNFMNQNDILLQQQRQYLQHYKKQSQRIQNRNKRLSQQITHLKDQNKQLKKQIKQKDHAIEIDQKLKQDKLDLLIQKKIKAQQAYRKLKQNIGKVFNLINQYGRPDLVQQMNNLLTNNHD